MTFTTVADRTRAVASTSSLMKTPDYLEAMVHSKRKTDFKAVAYKQQKREEEARRKELQSRRRAKLAVIERQVAEGRKSLSVPNTITSKYRAVNLIHSFCRVTGASQDKIISPCRMKKITLLRHVLVWILKNNTSLSLQQIGRRMGNRDHSSVLHALRRIEGRQELLDQAVAIEKKVLRFEAGIYNDN